MNSSFRSFVPYPTIRKYQVDRLRCWSASQVVFQISAVCTFSIDQLYLDILYNASLLIARVVWTCDIIQQEVSYPNFSIRMGQLSYSIVARAHPHIPFHNIFFYRIQISHFTHPSTTQITDFFLNVLSFIVPFKNSAEKPFLAKHVTISKVYQAIANSTHPRVSRHYCQVIKQEYIYIY